MASASKSAIKSDVTTDMSVTKSLVTRFIFVAKSDVIKDDIPATEVTLLAMFATLVTFAEIADNVETLLEIFANVFTLLMLLDTVAMLLITPDAFKADMFEFAFATVVTLLLIPDTVDIAELMPASVFMFEIAPDTVATLPVVA